MNEEYDDRIRVKVCGITTLEDALALDKRGMQFLGFNFWKKSKRYIPPEAAAEIIATLRHAEPVGVFVDHSPGEITDIAARTGIRWAQLHGSEGWEVLDKMTLPVIKAIPSDRLEDWGGLRAEWDQHPDSQPRYFLVDTRSGESFGGTGMTFDWKLLEKNPLPRPFFLAGGIGPGNLAEAMRAVRPFAVDLNSKVETAPGVKDVGLVEKCLGILRAL